MINAAKSMGSIMDEMPRVKYSRIAKGERREIMLKDHAIQIGLKNIEEQAVGMSQVQN